MSAWKRTGKRRACEICGHHGWCSYTEDGAVTCQYAGDQEVPGFEIVKGSAKTTGGTVYRLVGAAGRLTTLSQAEIELEQREAEKARKRQVAKAIDLWKEGVPNHPAAMGYVAGRGVPIEQLPGRTLPGAIRCTGDRTDWIKDDEDTLRQTTGPVLLASVVDASAKLIALQRVFLHPQTFSKRSTHAKLALGPLKGGACRLGNGFGDGTLILTEGVETGLAVLAAVSKGRGVPPAVWSCISTSGLKGVELPHDFARVGGPLLRIIIAGDHDELKEHLGHRPGAKAAEEAAARLKKLHPHIAVGVALPDHEHAHELVGADGAIEGKTVDWLDVYVRCGADRVAAAVLGCVAPAEVVPDQVWEGRDPPPRLRAPVEHKERAWLFLEQRYAPPAMERGQGWRLRMWNDRWWRFDSGRYVPHADKEIRAEAFRWLSSMYEWKGARNGGGAWHPLNPTEKSINALLTAVEAVVVLKVERMPVWLRENITEAGEKVYDENRTWESAYEPEQAAAAGLPDPLMLTPALNGLVDVRAWLDRRGVMLPHTELFFTRARLPYALDPDLLAKVASDDNALDEAIGRMCPVWLEFLASSTGEDVEMMDGLEMAAGLCLTPDMSFEVIPVLTGPPGSGKSTYLAGLFSMVGMDNVVISDLNLMANRFHLHACIGKSICAMTDAEVGRNTDAVVASETVKKISGGDAVYIDRKNKDALEQELLICKIVIACNHMPNLPDPSGAIVRRFRVFHFDESFTGSVRKDFKDPRVLLRESPGRLLWALRGLRALHALGKFPQPAKGRQILNEYAAYADQLGEFRDECLELKEAAFEYTTDLYASWVKSCGSAGKKPHSRAWFGKELRAACPKIKRVQKERLWGYEGVRIRLEARVTSTDTSTSQPFPPA